MSQKVNAVIRMKFIYFFTFVTLLGCTSNSVKEELSFTIGTKSFIWTDNNRTDVTYGGKRLVNVQIWYPSDSSLSSIKTPYYYKIDKAFNHLSNWTNEDYLFVSKISTNSFKNSSISKKQSNFPVLFLSPSLGGNFSMYTYYAEHLVKSGFVVVGVNHLYESEYVINHKNKVISANLKFHDSLKTLDIPKQITAEKYREVKGLRQKVLGEDLVFCISKLKEVNVNQFEGRLDLNKIGTMGHSTEGSASIYASLLDKRIKAVLNIDGTPPTVAMENGLTVPFMFIEDLTDYKNHKGYKKMHKRRSDFCKLNTADSYRILIAETNHNSFLDINYHAAKNSSEKKKALDVLKKTQGYMLQFFNHYLKNKELNIKTTQSNSLEIIAYKGK